jgi:Domain of unknown function (DUF4166)/Saccharopine dehydrogenase NADP binding domain
MKILIVGGYGTFGGRIVELLESDSRLTLLVAGRSLDKAMLFCQKRATAQAQLIPLAFDREGDLSQQMISLEPRPDWVVDASGPFQDYGDQRYALIEACISNEINYLDLADGSSFVEGVRAFDARAKQANVFVLSGVSSFPVLTTAVVRRLEKTIPNIHAIHAGIAPSPFAGVGLNVIKAIASYAGQPTQIKRQGRFQTAYPLTEAMPFVIAVPGHVPLKSRRFSLVDVPDLQALAQLWPTANDVWMGAAPVPSVLHRLLIGFAWCVRLRVLPSLLPFASIISWVTNHIRWGEHSGGMFVQVQGTDGTGQLRVRQWHLLAEGDDGPLIPSMAVQALVLRALNGQRPEAGARAATRELELSDYEPLFATRRLFTGEREAIANAAIPLYQQVLGDAWCKADLPIRLLHLTPAPCYFSGLCHVERGRGFLAKLVANVIGFPRPGHNQPIEVTFAPDVTANGARAERWTRKISGRFFSSQMSLGEGRWQHLLCERFGVATYAIALVPKQGGVDLVLRGWSIGGCPMPLFLAPSVTASESAEDGRFNFHIDISHPWLGLIVRYYGHLINSNKSQP